ncbi:D-aspartate oxidase-like [Glandiceps talaboti]
MAPHKVGVIGAGMIGLSSAVNILENIPNLEVTIIADKFSPNTTGDGIPGLCMPYQVGTSQQVHQQKQWVEDSFRHFESILKTEDSYIAGVGLISGWQVQKTPVLEDPYWSKIVYNYRRVSTEEISRLFTTVKFGVFYTLFRIDMKTYLRWLMERFLNQGGKIINKHITDIKELSGCYDVAVNCTGTNARIVAGDKSVYPVRGQLLRVKAPWIKHLVFQLDGDEESPVQIMPCGDDIMLGGIVQRGNWNTEPDENDRKKILEGCCRLVPSLKHATIVNDWVGLRPGRPSVRLEKEIIQGRDTDLKVVHNYGHGGSGISFHWGCAQEATRLVGDFLGHKVNMKKVPVSKL